MHEGKNTALTSAVKVQEASYSFKVTQPGPIILGKLASGHIETKL